MKIYVASDHGGFERKEKIKTYLRSLDYDVEDVGNTVLDPNDDYPDFIIPLARKVAADPESRGIILGVSGQGEAIAANRIKGVRAFVFYGPAMPKEAVDVTGRQSTNKYENVRLSREHNNSNVISFGARFLGDDEVEQVIAMWLKEPFPGDERHLRRIQKIDELS